jgi:hypothetical protein
MHWNEAHHSRPHFHARYAGQAASIDLDGNLIAGALPRRALTLVSGHGARDKIVQLEGVGPGQIDRRLASAASPDRPRKDQRR